MEDNTSMGELIRTARKNAGLSQIDVAKKAGISVNSLRLYEGDKRKPKLEAIKRIAAALGASPLSLVDFDTATEMLTEDMNTPLADRLSTAFDQLNELGQETAVERVEELTEIPKYRRDAETPAEAASGPTETK